MKRLSVVVLVGMLMICASGCGSNAGTGAAESTVAAQEDRDAAQETAAMQPEDEETESAPETESVEADADTAETGNISEPETESEEAEETEEVQEDAEEIVLSAAAGHQLSAFIAMADNMDYDIFHADAESCMWMMFNYIDNVRNVTQGSATDNLPFKWNDRIVTKEEFDRFFGDSWGVNIPADFNYQAGEADYGLHITDSGLESTIDGSLYMAIGGDVKIISVENGTYHLQGTFQNGAMDDETLGSKTFTATAVKNDDSVFDGLQITGFQVQ